MGGCKMAQNKTKNQKFEAKGLKTRIFKGRRMVRCEPEKNGEEMID